ncbi:MAG: aminopeptidase [Gammaproteobacteria bacterium]|nr:aminopeptidase [Gammaproteobacteria bacterium]
MKRSGLRKRRFTARTWIWLALLAGVIASTGCTSTQYLLQATRGHLAIMMSGTRVADIVSNPETPAGLAEKLRPAARMREFASAELGLPDNESYQTYVDLERDYVVWNVVAAPELSLTPKTWCFPIAGCVAYRGYFDRAAALAFADELRAEGYDVYSGPVRAYSTLGWFSDPLLNTMVDHSEDYTAGIIFHELTHQVVYIKDDSAFNEAFAIAVQREGVERWFRHTDRVEKLAGYRARLRRQEQFIALVLKARQRLGDIYGSGGERAAMRAAKVDAFEVLRRDYRKLKDSWGGAPGYDAWFQTDLNNAKLAAVATYFEKARGFQQLFADNDGDFARFYEAVRELGNAPRAERHRVLEALGEKWRLRNVSTSTQLK